MTFLTKNINSKKPIISFFEVKSRYNILGGITDIHWMSENNFLSIVYFRSNIRFYLNTSNICLFLNKTEKINLVSIGLFGIAFSSIIVTPIQIEKIVKSKKYLDNTDVFKTNSKLNKPIIKNFIHNNDINKSVLVTNKFSIKNMNFKININKLNFTK